MLLTVFRISISCLADPRSSERVFVGLGLVGLGLVGLGLGLGLVGLGLGLDLAASAAVCVYGICC